MPGRSQSPLEAALYFLLYVAGVVLVGALLAYPLFQMFTALGLDVPFHKVVSRTQKLMALLCLIPLLHLLQLNNRRGWGWPSRLPVMVGQVARGWCAGALIMGFIVIVLFSLGVRVWEAPDVWSLSALARTAVKALIVGVVVGVLEEFWFRGGLHSVIHCFLGRSGAIVLTAGLYAAVHFVRPDQVVAPDSVDWSSGLLVLMDSFARFNNLQIVDSLMALFTAGVLLSLIRSHTGSIAWCVGLHAGWVFVIKFTRSHSHVEWGNQWVFLVGHYDAVIGLLTMVVVGLCALTYYLVKMRLQPL